MISGISKQDAQLKDGLEARGVIFTSSESAFIFSI